MFMMSGSKQVGYSKGSFSRSYTVVSHQSVLPLGTRVASLTDGRKALVLDGPERCGRVSIYRVAIEGSTRAELWSDNQLRPLAKKSQLVALGGKYEPPPGYPHFTVRRAHGKTQTD